MFLRLAYLAFRAYTFVFRPVRLGVRILIVKNSQVLLVRQSYVHGWFMPGGGVKRGETLDEAARREAREEVGAELGELKLVGAFTNFKEWKSDHNIVFVSEAAEITQGGDSEVAEARFFPLNALPDGLWPGHRQRIEEFAAGVVHPRFGEW